MKSKKTFSKDEIFFAVCSAILKLEFAKGHLQWSVSDVARTSGITRSLIYYYFGKEKSTVLKEAYRFVTQIFFDRRSRDLTPENSNTQNSGHMIQLKATLVDLQKMPNLFVLYYLNKNADNEYGQMIRKAEQKLIKDLHKSFPNLSHQEIQKFYLLELGCLAYQVPPKEVDQIFSEYLD